MSTPVRVALFVTALALVFGTAWGAGRLVEDRVGPVEAATDSHARRRPTPRHRRRDGGRHGRRRPRPRRPPGQRVRLHPGAARDRAGAGPQRPCASWSPAPTAQPVTAYDEEHEKDLHLIAVRRDLSGYQHVHPTMAADGTWTTDVDLTPGSWRVFADFTPTGGPALTLGTDLDVAGRFAPAPHPGHRVTDTVDGYTVDLVGDLDDGRRHRARQPRRRARHRPRALPRRLRPPGRAARGRPGLPPRAPGGRRRRARTCRSRSRCPARAATGCSSTSSTTGVVRTAELAVRSHGTDTHDDTDEEGMTDDH